MWLELLEREACAGADTEVNGENAPHVARTAGAGSVCRSQ